MWQRYIQQCKNKHVPKAGTSPATGQIQTHNGSQKVVCLIAKLKSSSLQFSPSFRVKSKVVDKKYYISKYSFSLSIFHHPISLSYVANLEFGGWRYGGHKSHCYWRGYEPQPNGDDSARSFSSAFPLQRWALDTVHLTCHFPVLHSTICTEPIRTRRTFNFICSSTLQGFFFFPPFSSCLAQCSPL